MLIIMLSNPEKGRSQNQKCDATNCFSLFHTIGSTERMNDTLFHLYTSRAFIPSFKMSETQPRL